MEGTVFLLGVIGNILSVLVFLSPVKTFGEIVKRGSTEEFESLPYICTLLSACLWTYYGLTKPDAYLVATVNAFGIFVEILYLAFFIFFAPPSKRVKTAVAFGAVNVGCFGAAVAMTEVMLEGDDRMNSIGVISAAFSIIMYASPLSAMKRVVATKSVEYMPFFFSLFLFLCGGVWTLYALLAHDWFIGVPNGIGAVLGAVQLAVYAIYYSNSSSKHLHHHTYPLLIPISTTTNL